MEFGRQTGFIAVATGIIRGAMEEGVASRGLGKAEGAEDVVPAFVGLAESGGSFLFSKSEALCWSLCPELRLF